MSKNSLIGLALSGVGMVLGFIGGMFADKGAKEDLIAEIESEYVLVPKLSEKED
jgi:hypothetical protein